MPSNSTKLAKLRVTGDLDEVTKTVKRRDLYEI